jgi:hypothetical protein
VPLEPVDHFVDPSDASETFLCSEPSGTFRLDHVRCTWPKWSEGLGKLSRGRLPVVSSLWLHGQDWLEGRRQPLALSGKTHAAGLLPFCPMQPLVPLSVAFAGHILGSPPGAQSREKISSTALPTHRPPVPVAPVRPRPR